MLTKSLEAWLATSGFVILSTALKSCLANSPFKFDLLFCCDSNFCMKFFASLSVKPACFNKSFIKPFLFSSCENEFSSRLLVDR